MAICSLTDIYNDQNVARTVEPFIEFRIHRPYEREAMFTVSRIPKEGFIPLFKIYMSLAVDDPSEMKFVEEVFGDFAYWMILCESTKFKPYIQEWRYIASVKRKQKAFEAIVKELNSDKPSRFAAAKYLIEESWRGGATSAERRKARKYSQETSEEAFKQAQVEEDIKRLQEQGLIN